MKKLSTQAYLGILGLAMSLMSLSFTIAPSSQECDKLIMQNGDEIMVKIVEITSTEIIYRPCNELDGINVRLPLRKAFMIKYANGGKQIFEKDSRSNGSRAPRGDVKPEESSANTALLLGILGLFFFWPVLSIIAWVMGNKSLRRIRENPDYYAEHSQRQARTGRTLGIISVLLPFIVILLFVLIRGLI